MIAKTCAKHVRPLRTLSCFKNSESFFFPLQCPVITEMRAFGPWFPLVDLACPATRVACKMHSQLSKPHVRMNSLQQPTVPCTILNRFLMFETPALKPVQVIPKLSMLGVSWTMLITRIMFVRQEDRKQSLHAKPSDPRNKSNLETLKTSTPIPKPNLCYEQMSRSLKQSLGSAASASKR